MADTYAVTQETEETLARTVMELRHSMLIAFLWATALTHVAWYYVVAFSNHRFYLHTVIILFLIPILYLAYRLHRKHEEISAWLLLGSIWILQALVVARFPSATALALGVLGVMAANALCGAGTSLLATLLLWLGGIGAWTFTSGSIPLSIALGALGLYALAWGASWLAKRPMRASTAWAIAGWTQARLALGEVQSRRGELYRALRALEEATYRIERMNRELIVARRDAELAKAQKSRFAATVSHELRGPLSLILGFSRIMALTPERYGAPLPEPYWSDVDAIYRSSQHLAALVDDVLDLAQIEAERLPLVKDRVDVLADVVEKAVGIVRPLAERKGLYLRVEPNGELPWILADSVRLRQALLNLLTNAVRFTERGGIEVRADLVGDGVRLTVSDTGPGIPAADVPLVFRAFSQVSGSQSDRDGVKGSGLGLSISKELIELHGGRIWLESKEGLGTRVSIELPLPGRRPSDALAHTEDLRSPTAQAEPCLVVHDDPSVTRLLARHISNYRLVAVGHEELAALLVRDLHPRAVIASEEWMSRAQSLLAELPFDVPLIGCRLPKHTEGMPASLLAYLIKPIPPEVLASIMRQVERDVETTVLIADDDPDAVRLLEMILTALPRPYRILRAHDGNQALRVMIEARPDVVFLDLVMPGLSGEQVLEQMQRRPELANTPVVIVSAHEPADASVSLRGPISLHFGGEMDLARAGACLQTLVAMASPRYLPEPI